MALTRSQVASKLSTAMGAPFTVAQLDAQQSALQAEGLTLAEYPSGTPTATLTALAVTRETTEGLPKFTLAYATLSDGQTAYWSELWTSSGTVEIGPITLASSGGGGISTIEAASDTNFTGKAAGDVMYWDGTDWINLAAADDGDLLTLSSGVPAWTTPSYLTAEVNDLSAAVTWANVPDANITESSVTQHADAIAAAHQLGNVGGINISAAGAMHALTYDNIAGEWVNAALSTSYIQSGTFNDARISESSVTQHEGAIDHGSIAGLTDDDHAQYLLADGARGLSDDWDAGSHKITAEQLESDIATGTAPLVIASATLVDNLNVEHWGGKKHYGSLATASQPSGAGINDGDEYYDTTISRTCVYNGVKDKWFVKGGSGQVHYNYNGNCSAGSYLRGFGGMPLVSARGTPVPKCTIVALYYSQSSSSASTLNFKQGATAFSWSVPASNAETFDYTLNEDLSADNLSPENDSGGPRFPMSSSPSITN
jgi:hypothetical protein